jgi:hypothetical protein
LTAGNFHPEVRVIRILLLVVSAFTAFVALVTVVDGVLMASASDGTRLWILGVILVGVLCWLRWRWQWRNVLLTFALIMGAAALVVFAVSGVGQSVQLSSSRAFGGLPHRIIDLLLGAQAILMATQLWMDRRQGSRSAESRAGDADDTAR